MVSVFAEFKFKKNLTRKYYIYIHFVLFVFWNFESKIVWKNEWPGFPAILCGFRIWKKPESQFPQRTGTKFCKHFLISTDKFSVIINNIIITAVTTTLLQNFKIKNYKFETSSWSRGSTSLERSIDMNGCDWVVVCWCWVHQQVLVQSVWMRMRALEKNLNS